jgi:DHA1 family bicyclomycin/chloramphenicol resistance-like MFS transporter
VSATRAPSLPILALLIGAFLFLGPAATDSFLPAIAAIAADLEADIRLVEISLPVMFVGSAIGHLVYGPLSDRIGRRPVLVAAALLWTAAAVGAGLAGSVEALIFWRFVQGLTIAAGRIVGTAAARDVFEKEPLRRLLSYTLLINSVSPVISAPIGGLLLEGFGWRSVFVYQTAVGGLCFFLCLALFTETLPRKDERALKLAVLAENYGGIFAHLPFLRFSLVSGLVIGGIMVFLTSAPGVMIGQYNGVTPVSFGFMFAILMMVVIACTFAAGRLSRRYSLTAMVLAGGTLAAVGGLTLLAFSIARIEHAAAIMMPMTVFVAAFGVTMPQAVAGAMQPFHDKAGAASSVLGFTQYALGAAIAWTASHFADGTALPFSTGIAACGVATLVIAVLIRRAGPAAAD